MNVIPMADLSHHPKVLSREARIETFGEFFYSESKRSRGEIEILDLEWMQNLVPARVSEMTQIHGFPHSGMVMLHRKVVPSFRAAMDDILDDGLIGYLLTWDGGFVARHIGWNPARQLSSHSWGIAFDVNARWNAYGSKPAEHDAPGSVHALVPILEKHGWAWGGRWNTPDGMHFEHSGEGL